MRKLKRKKFVFIAPEDSINRKKIFAFVAFL
jgi:hypothetical protein